MRWGGSLLLDSLPARPPPSARTPVLCGLDSCRCVLKSGCARLPALFLFSSIILAPAGSLPLFPRELHGPLAWPCGEARRGLVWEASDLQIRLARTGTILSPVTASSVPRPFTCLSFHGRYFVIVRVRAADRFISKYFVPFVPTSMEVSVSVSNCSVIGHGNRTFLA